MPASIIYDLSRLITRVLNATPNGIDRVDWLLARHYLNHRQFETSALAIGWTGPRLLSHATSRDAAERVAEAWSETSSKRQHSIAYEEVVARLREKAEPRRRPDRIVETRPKRALNVAKTLLHYAPRWELPPRVGAPQESIYLNAANFPLEWKRHVAWLDQRSDIRPVFFVHDLLPIERPEWFWTNEPSRHARRLNLLARRGAAAIVASANVEQDLRNHLRPRGRGDLPIFRRGLPVSQIFSETPALDPRLAGVPFFMTCGTIEPRKNHLLLFDIWRDLATRQGIDAPKLIVVGNRGWNSKEIVTALEDDVLRGHIIEVAGLPTPDYKRLLDHCQALLAPSFAEGFGLPVAEALATGTPIIASAIPPFLEQGGDHPTYLDPLAKREWREAILTSIERPPRSRMTSATAERAADSAESAYLSALDEFLKRL
jgi:glycosyltransferase involved in cell wall biosynthesis